MPDLISSVLPDVPQNIRAVPRAGQRELGKVSDGLDSQMVKILGFGEDD
jgi:hypothetical protein